jgi:signal transduction histidine kinase
MIVIDLIDNLSVLVALSVVSGFIDLRFDRRTRMGMILQGILFGINAVIGMLNPFVLTHGIIFDGRSIVISLCTLYFGPIAGTITAFIALAFRIYLGGVGTIMGTAVIVSSWIIGWLFYYWRAKKNRRHLSGLNLYVFGILVHLAMLALIFTLPSGYINTAFRTISLTVIGIYPVITILIGKILLDQQENKLYVEEIRLMNAELESRISNRTQELQDAVKELEAFSYSVSHDLRTPLRAINGFARYLVDDYGQSLDEEGKKITTIILDSTKHMGQLIDDLLHFSRISRSEISRMQIPMNKLIQEIYNELTDKIDTEKIDFQVEPLEDCEGDYAMIKQVWLNLISNALKFTARKDKRIIHISCSHPPGRVVYCIRDNGAGFNMKYYSHLFEVFHRLHTVREFEGTGVGLALVKRIIQKHGGEVWAKGEPNEGAEFYCSLPI